MLVRISDGETLEQIQRRLRGRLSLYTHRLENSGMDCSMSAAIELFVQDCDCTPEHVKDVLEGKALPGHKLLSQLSRAEWSPDEPIYVPVTND